jgi:EmrB/QacA subfamily drug resistance transporter
MTDSPKPEGPAPGGRPLHRIHHRLPYKWIALSVTTIGSLMAAIDATIVVLALPEMMIKLHANLVEMIWVIMGYILVSTVFLLTFGRVADMFGRVRMYNLGFVVFTVGSLLCGLSTTAGHLIVFRLVQGSGAAMMLVNSMAILTEAFPPNERGRALGINSITWSFGGVFGPILGGLILGAADWRWIFFINVPIGIVGAAWGYRVLREQGGGRRAGERFNPGDAGMFSVGLTALLLALTLGIQLSWTSTPVVVLFVLAVGLLTGFVLWEKRAEFPALDLTLFRSRVYNFSVAAGMMQALGLFAVNFLIVFYFQGVRGFDPLKAALLLIPMPLVNSVMAPLGGWVADRIGARVPATLGLLVQAAALGWFLGITPTTPYIHIGAGLALMGVGGGLFFPSNTSAAMNAAPRHRLGIASATLATLRQAGMVTGFALSLAVAAGSLPREVMMQLFVGNNVILGSKPMQAFVVGMHSAFVLSIVLCLVAAGFSWVRGKEDRRRLAQLHAAGF